MVKQLASQARIYYMCQGVPAGIGAESKQSVEGRESAGEYLCNPLEMEARRL